MRAKKEYLSANILHSFRVKHTILPYMDSPWHYHPDYELIYIVRGKGKRFVGDIDEDFTHGDLVLLGPNVPHIWKSDEQYLKGDTDLNFEVIVIQFKHDAFGETFFQLPEFKELIKVLDYSLRGLKISGETKVEVVKQMWRMLEISGIDRIAVLLNILGLLCTLHDLTPICLTKYKHTQQVESSGRLNNVLDYISSNFQKDIQLSEVAGVANMSKTAFCRFFKLKTTKTFNQYITDVRISYACELLIESDMSVSQIATLCGYNNQSYFNRKFKAIKGETPKSYYLRYKYI